MIFWLLACVLVAVIVVFTLLPMMRAGEAGDALDFAREFYRDREVELKAQLASGEIDQVAFDAALAEQGRRLLALARTSPEQGRLGASVARRKLAALVMLLGVPLFGIGLYLKLGRPGMPDAPLASRQMATKDFDIATAIEKIEAHLAKNPDDAKGFEVVAPVYLKAGRFEDAARAWRRVIEISGATAQRQGDLGEALVAMGSGIVNTEARMAFEAALQLEPDMPKARYYLALALEQDGRKDAAAKALESLRDTLPDSPARARVESEIARIKGVPSGPAAESLAAMPEQDRQQAIGSMVDGLEARLLEKGGASEDWQKLMRARLVLGQKDRAAVVLEKARSAFKDKPEGPALIEALEAMLKSAR